MKTNRLALALPTVLFVGTDFAAPPRKLKLYFALKVKAFNQSMFVTQDRKGNTYLAGTTSSTQFDFNTKDWLVAKYGPTGAKLWVRTFNGKGNGGDIPGAIKIDRLGNVIVCGYTTGVTQEGSAGAVVKWDSNGNRKYVRYQPGTASAAVEYDDYRAMAVDYLGNIYVAGSKTGPPVSGVDLLVEKLSPTLVPIWSRTWSQTSGSQLEQALSMDLHANGTAYISGDAPYQEQNAGGFWVYSSQGAMLKFVRFLGNDGYGRVSSVRAMGNRVYVFGDFRGTGLASNEASLFTNVYNSSGSLVHKRLVIGNATISRNTVDGGVGPDGSFAHLANAYVNGDAQVQSVRYNSSGVALGPATINLPNSVFGEHVVVHNQGNSGIFYSTGGRMLYAPILNNVLQSNQAMPLTLPGQTYDRPSVSPTGEVLVPYSQNGAAGVRIFDTTVVRGGFSATEVKEGGSVGYTYFAADETGYGRVRIRIYLAGQETTLVERNASFGPGQEPGDESLTLPPGAKAGGFLFMTIEQMDANNKPVGPAETQYIPIVK